MGLRVDQSVALVARHELSPSCFALEVLCPQPFSPVPGQFVMVGLEDGYDPLLRRPFSIAAVGREDDHQLRVELIIKEVGKTTRALRHVSLGAQLRLLGPLGKGFHLAATGTCPALIAGGIGLAPMLFAAEMLSRSGVHFDFYFGAATAHELLLKERVALLTPGEAIFCTDDGSFGEAGVVTQALKRRLNRGYTRILACGPTPMLRELARLSRREGITAELSLEEPMACGVGVCLGCVVRLRDGRFATSCKEGPVFLADDLSEDW